MRIFGSSKQVTLPGRDEIIRRLARVYGDEHMRQHLYPGFAALSGQPLTPEQLVEKLLEIRNTFLTDYENPDVRLTIKIWFNGMAEQFVSALADNKRFVAKVRPLLFRLEVE